MREHDVVLTVISGHHTFFIAVERRDRNRPVGVTQLEAFTKKCQETGVGQGVIVSPTGFAKTALVKAKALGIRCLTLEQVNVLPWLLCEYFELYKTQYLQFHFDVIPENDFEQKPVNFILETDEGENITVDMLRNNLIQAFNKEKPEESTKPKLGTYTHHVNIIPQNLSIIDSATGRKERVKQINTTYKCKTELKQIPLVLQEYRDVGDPESIAQIASVDLDLGFTSGKFLINQKLETGGEIVFIPNDKKKPNKPN